MYISTRGQEKLTASQAILKGLASNGGLFVPEVLPKVDVLKEFSNLSYVETAKKVLELFLDDFTQEEIAYAVDSAYDKVNFTEKHVGITVKDNISFLELYHGPTLAFKDMALTILPYLVEISKKKNNETRKSLILVATSGDTGGAALSSFKKSGTFDTVVLYPNGGVSEIQEKQMLYYTNERTKAYAVDGNFDDCQTFVKEIFSSYNKQDVLLSSANSINIGRLIPQIIYYVYYYVQAIKTGVLTQNESFTCIVPTGNFGDIFAGFLAYKMGVPISKFVCASNKNNVLTDFFESGVYNKNREFYKSNSPAMDILISSNLERLLYYAVNKNASKVSEYMDNLNSVGEYRLTKEEMENIKIFKGVYSTEEQTLLGIKSAYDKYGYVIDPHTAVAYNAYERLNLLDKCLIVSTASPYKFPFTVASALGLDATGGEVAIIKRMANLTGGIIPEGINKLLDSNKPTLVKSKQEILDKVYYKKECVEISVPCSSANLGCGFDTAGLALNLYNTFKFEQAEKDQVIGFYSSKVEDNLILKSYKKLFTKTNKEYVPVKITMINSEVPTSRGLGSSATCIVAGVLGADYMLKHIFTEQQLLSVMAEIEGHPDNVAPCYLGGMVCSYMKEDKTVSFKYNVNKNLKFIALIPDFELSTKDARKALPKTYSKQDVVNNVSRASCLGKAFEVGELSLIEDIFSDKIHVPYRLKLIKGGQEIIKQAKSQGFTVTISGAGPTLLAVGDKNSSLNISNNINGVKWQVKELCISQSGATLK